MGQLGAGGTGSPPARVLVVDDSAEAREAVRRTLEREGFVVDQAGDGVVALQSLARLAPDLVLLDLGMPGLGGLEVLARLRRTNTVPVVVLSGEEDEEVRVSAFELGADDYVVKPFPARELPARIRSLLRRAQPGPPPVLDFGSLVIRGGGAEGPRRGHAGGDHGPGVRPAGPVGLGAPSRHVAGAVAGRRVAVLPRLAGPRHRDRTRPPTPPQDRTGSRPPPLAGGGPGGRLPLRAPDRRRFRRGQSWRTGSLTKNVVPSPGVVSNHSEPLCRWVTIEWVRARP